MCRPSTTIHHNLRTFEVYRLSIPNKHHAGKFVKRCLANTGAGSLALGLSAVTSTWSRQQVNMRRWNMTQKKNEMETGDENRYITE